MKKSYWLIGIIAATALTIGGLVMYKRKPRISIEKIDSVNDLIVYDANAGGQRFTGTKKLSELEPTMMNAGKFKFAASSENGFIHVAIMDGKKIIKAVKVDVENQKVIPTV